ncbi:hypothetical protein ACVWZ3_008498 [Bradyrhizobium sp. i1.3.6]
MLDRLQDLALGGDDVVEGQGHAERQLLEHLRQHRMRRLDAAVERLAAIGRVIGGGVGERGADALKNCIGLKRPRDRVGGAQCPGLHGAVMQGIGEHEQPRHRAIGIAAQLVAHPLHALGRAQIDVDHETGQIARRLLGNVLRRHRRNVAHGLSGCWQARCSRRSGRKRARAGVLRRIWLARSWLPQSTGLDLTSA